MSSSAFAAKVAKVSDEANRSFNEDVDSFIPPVGEYHCVAIPDENGDRLQVDMFTPKGKQTEYPIIGLNLEIIQQNGDQGMLKKKVKTKVWLNPDDKGNNRGATTIGALLRSAKIPHRSLEEALVALNEALVDHAIRCETTASPKGEYFNLRALVPMGQSA